MQVRKGKIGWPRIPRYVISLDGLSGGESVVRHNGNHALEALADPQPTSETTLPAPGWYSDTVQPGQRWWDGQRWTEHRNLD